ncbi:MAG TPA: hypothetical protein VIR60_02855 [Gammaproteobacteria bacterium]
MNHSGKRTSQSLRIARIDSIRRRRLLFSTEDCHNGSIRYLMMNPLFRRNAASRHTISWILVVALLLLTLVPFHYHLHHADQPPSDAASVPAHVTDIHILGGSNESDHHDGTHTLEPTPDIALKQNGVHLPLFAALLVLSVLLPLVAGLSLKPAAVSAQRLPRFHRHNTPPLRAPPRD